jgi:membrane protein involved in colicin uptake
MKTQEQKAFQRDLIISLVLHLIFVVIFIYGIPSIFEKLPEENQVITFEMLTVSDIVNVRNQDIKKPEPKEIKESKKIEKSSTKAKEELKEPEEKPVEKTEVVEKEAEIVPEKEKKKEIPKKEEKPKKVIPPKKEKEKVKPKKIEKPVKKQEDVIDSILQNLEKESDGEKKNSLNRTTSSQENEGKFARGNHDEDSPLSITEKMLIKQQIEDNWTQVVGNLENIKVKISLELEIDGTVTKADILSINCPPGADQICQLVAETTKRAVKKASPVKNLRPDRYDIWKKFDLDFYPGSM